MTPVIFNNTVSVPETPIKRSVIIMAIPVKNVQNRISSLPCKDFCEPSFLTARHPFFFK